MKYTYAILFTLLLLSSSPAGPRDALHTFTTPDGRTLKASIIQYDAAKNSIRIQREDGAKFWTAPTAFTEADQAYIQQWILADQFLSSMRFKIDGKSNEETDIQYKTVDGDRIKESEKTTVDYQLTLLNRTAYALKNLRIEYRAFIQRTGYGNHKDQNRVVSGKVSLNEIDAGKTGICHIPTLELETVYQTRRDISTSDTGRISYSSYAVKTNEDDLKGIWVRVYGPSLDGEQLYREWCYPADTMKRFEWTAEKSK